jgi:hypothetical protein
MKEYTCPLTTRRVFPDCVALDAVVATAGADAGTAALAEVETGMVIIAPLLAAPKVVVGVAGVETAPPAPEGRDTPELLLRLSGV